MSRNQNQQQSQGAAAAPLPAPSAALQPFKPYFLSTPGEPPVPWQRWINMFNDYMLVVGFPTGDLSPTLHERKAALLRASLGTEGYRIYMSLADDTYEPYGEAVDRLRRHFDQTGSRIFARAQFSRCLQRRGESVGDYIANLREMAAKCGFPAAQLNERVRDQFVAWCACDKIRERLLQEPDTRTLDEMMIVAQSMERAMAEAPALMSSSANNSPSSAPVGRIASRRDGRHHQEALPRSPPRGSSDASAERTACTNCGSAGHDARSESCPARGRRCNYCQLYGHFRSVCRRRRTSGSGRAATPARQRSTSAVANNVESDTDSQTDEASSAVGSVYISMVSAPAVASTTATSPTEADSVFVDSVTSYHEPGAFKVAKCRVGNAPIDLLIDLGAKVSIINRKFYERHLSHRFKLYQPELTLRDYSRRVIPCAGCIDVPVALNDILVNQFPMYVVERGQPVMGVNLFDALGGVVTFPTSAQVNNVTDAGMTSSVKLQDYPTLLKPTAGTLKGFVHRPQIDPAV